MTTEQLKKAKQSGAVTALELDIWYSGYLQGQKDTFEEVTKDVKKSSDDFYRGASTDQSKNMDSRETNSYMEA